MASGCGPTVVGGSGTRIDASDAAAAQGPARDATRPLTARSQTWLDDQPCALSCHTTVPFVLASPHLGPRAEPAVSQIVAATERRVALGDAAEPWYGHSAEKTRQSHATASVLSALVLGVADSPSYEAALDRMFAQQQADGYWTWLDFGLHPWETRDAAVAGAAWAVVATRYAEPESLPADGMARLEAYVRAQAQRPASLHDRMMVLWAASARPGMLEVTEVTTLVSDVCAHQQPDGHWRDADLLESRVPAAADGALATALATVALGGHEEATVCRGRGRAWLRAHQRRSGEWTGRSLNDDDRFNHRLATDAATALAVLALADD